MEPTTTPAEAAGATHPHQAIAQRRALVAAWSQIASGIVLCALLFGALTWDLVPDTDFQSYLVFLGLLLALILLVPALGLAIPAVGLLQRPRRSGAVWLIAAATLAVVEMVTLLVVFAPGSYGLGRVVVVGGAAIWLAVSVLAILAGAWAWPRLPAPR